MSALSAVSAGLMVNISVFRCDRLVTHESPREGEEPGDSKISTMGEHFVMGCVKLFSILRNAIPFSFFYKMGNGLKFGANLF